MIKDAFFDTDCLSSFLWAESEDIFLSLYAGRVFIPSVVIRELERVSFLSDRLKTYIRDGAVKVIDIQENEEEFKDYIQFISKQDGYKAIGKGEAAVIALAKAHNGIVASSNLKDISYYVDKYYLEYTTTAMILEEALDKGLITKNRGNQIWKKMKDKRRWLPAETFSEYLETKGK